MKAMPSQPGSSGTRWGGWLVMGSLVALAASGLNPPAHSAEADTPLTAQTEEPRAYGYQVGDVMTRHITVSSPSGLRLDEASLPIVGRLGQAFELRQVSWQTLRADQHHLVLVYQVFLAPQAVRTLELPPVSLRFVGTPRAQDLRIDAWPVTVAPLVPVEVSPRRGLGALQPDAEAPLINTTPARLRLWICAGLAALMLVYLAHVYLGLPWLARHRRPFESAWRALHAPAKGSPAEHSRAALQALHQALNRSAGAVLFEPGISAYLAAQPRFAGLHDELQQFFVLSRREFFGAAGETADPQATQQWLLAFCRRCRDAERGAA